MLMYLDTVPDGGETTFPDSVEKPVSLHRLLTDRSAFLRSVHGTE